MGRGKDDSTSPVAGSRLITSETFEVRRENLSRMSFRPESHLKESSLREKRLTGSGHGMGSDGGGTGVNE